MRILIIRYTNLLRYKAIMLPMTYYSTSKKTAVMIVVLIWALAFLIALPSAFFYQFTHIQDPSSGGLKVIFRIHTLKRNKGYQSPYNIWVSDWSFKVDQKSSLTCFQIYEQNYEQIFLENKVLQKLIDIFEQKSLAERFSWFFDGRHF